MKRDHATLSLYAIVGLLGFGVGILAPATKELRSDLDLSYAVAALHSTAYAMGFVISGVAGDRLIARVGRARMLSIAMTSTTAGIVMLCLGPSLVVTLPGAALIGGFGVFLQTVGTAVLSERHGEHRTTAVAELNAVVVSVGALVPVIVGAFVVSPLGWRATFLVAVVLFVVLLSLRSRPALVTALTTTANSAHEGGGADSSARLPAAFWWSWSLIAVAVSAEFAALIWGATYFEEELGASAAVAAVLSGTFFLAEGIGRLLGGPFARVAGLEKAMYISIVSAVAGFVIFWSADSPALGAVGYFVIGLGISNLGIFPTALALSTVGSGRAHDVATTRLAAAIGIAILAGPIILGWLADRAGIRDAYLALPVLLALTAAVTSVAHRVVRRHVKATEPRPSKL